MKKILVIEDSPDILSNIAEILELSNYKVYTAENGLKGVEAALSHVPDLIICDIMMPELDGYGVLLMVQKNPDLQGIPFIFLTAKSEASDIRKGMGMGADDYITKPFDATDLLNAVESRIRKTELLKSLALTAAGERNYASMSPQGGKALQEFVEGRHVDHYKKKQLIFTEGNHPIYLFYVQKGKVKIFKTNHEGKELILNILNEHEFFGYIALLEGRNYLSNAEAMEDSEIAAIPRAEFEELLKTNPGVTRKFLKMLAQNVTEREEHLIHIAYNSLRRKVADALLVAQQKCKDNPEEYKINMSRENLAAIAGTATESLIRTLSDFKNEHLVDIKEGRIAILNEDKIRKMAN
jgi:DNA-binding response OmpR family regulator